MKRVLLTLAVCALTLSAETLRELAAQRGILFGAAADAGRLSETAYADALAREFNQLQPETALTFATVHPAASTYDFAAGDALVEFARTRAMAVRGRALVWHQQNPAWLTSTARTRDELAAVLQDHIRTVVTHYAGQIYAWDVVNEGFLDNGTLRSTIWSDSPGIRPPGTNYIETAFRWANEADPRAKLFYNDSGAETINAKSNAIYVMAKDFEARGVPLHGIGLQMHLTTDTASIAELGANMKRFIDLGLEIHITELDVRLPVNSSGISSGAALGVQASVYREVISLCLRYPQCSAIQLSGVTDKYSSVPAAFPGFGAALLLDAGYRVKPAYDSIANLLESTVPEISAIGVTNAASFANDAVSPGEIFSLFGATYGPASLTLAQPGANGLVPTQVAGTRIYFDGVPSPIIFARVGQVNAIVPFSVSGRTTAQVQYEYRGLLSKPVTVKVVPTTPGVFTYNGSGVGSGAILNSAFGLVYKDTPAKKNDVVLLYATGSGVYTTSVPDGQILTALPLPAPAVPVSVTIGGVNCPVLYAGGAYGLVAGALQINVQLRPGVPSGEQPLVVRMGNAVSQPGLTIWVE